LYINEQVVGPWSDNLPIYCYIGPSGLPAVATQHADANRVLRTLTSIPSVEGIRVQYAYEFIVLQLKALKTMDIFNSHYFQ